MSEHEQLRVELRKIEKWEKDQKGLFFWERLARLPFSALDKVTPKFIHQKIEKLLDEIAKYVDNGGQYLANTSATLEKASAQLQEKKQLSIEDIQHLSLQEMDGLAEYFIEVRKKNAQLQGATTGVGGFLHWRLIFLLYWDLHLRHCKKWLFLMVTIPLSKRNAFSWSNACSFHPLIL